MTKIFSEKDSRKKKGCAVTDQGQAAWNCAGWISSRMNGNGHSGNFEGVFYAVKVLTGYRYIFFNAIHFQIDPAIFP